MSERILKIWRGASPAYSFYIHFKGKGLFLYVHSTRMYIKKLTLNYLKGGVKLAVTASMSIRPEYDVKLLKLYIDKEVK